MQAMSLRDEQLWGSPGRSHWHYQIEMNQILSVSPLSCAPVQELNLSMVQHLPNTGPSTTCPQRWAEGEAKKLSNVFIQFINS